MNRTGKGQVLQYITTNKAHQSLTAIYACYTRNIFIPTILYLYFDYQVYTWFILQRSRTVVFGLGRVCAFRVQVIARGPRYNMPHEEQATARNDNLHAFINYNNITMYRYLPIRFVYVLCIHRISILFLYISSQIRGVFEGLVSPSLKNNSIQESIKIHNIE